MLQKSQRIANSLNIGLFVLLAALGLTATASLAQAQQTITICKNTIPSSDPTSFAFTWENGFGVQGGVPLAHGQCYTYDVTAMDKYNVFTETLPQGWTLVGISCVAVRTNVQIFGANPNPGFQPGDNSVGMDLIDAQVTCTFTNQHNEEPEQTTGYLEICKEVIDRTGGSPTPASFPIHLECSNAPGIWIDVPLGRRRCSTNNPSRPGYSGLPPSPAGVICRVQENGSAPWPTPPLSMWHPDAGPLPIVDTPRCRNGGRATWSTSFPNGAIAVIPQGGTATIRIRNELTCAKRQNDCVFKRNLSTGVAAWTVNGAPAYTTSRFSSWATGFPPGTQWIQPTSGGVPVGQPVGRYRYQLRFEVPRCVLDRNGQFKVGGSFAADNGAILKVGSNPPVPCSGNPSVCFQQSHVTYFSQSLSGVGPHLITIDVTNDGALSGLIANVVIP